MQHCIRQNINPKIPSQKCKSSIKNNNFKTWEHWEHTKKPIYLQSNNNQSYHQTEGEGNFQAEDFLQANGKK